MQGLFRNVLAPFAKRMGQGAMDYGAKGFSSMKANMGYGWSALKSDPKALMGFGDLQAVGRLGRAIRPGNVGALGPQMGRSLRRWGTGADLAGQGGKRGVGVASRWGAVGGAAAGADFLNPWGLGWGD